MTEEIRVGKVALYWGKFKERARVLPAVMLSPEKQLVQGSRILVPLAT